MQVLLDSGVAMLAAIGIWTLGRLIWDTLMADASVVTVIPTSGDGSDLKYTVRRQQSKACSQSILLVDCGLSSQGLCAAQGLVETNRNIWLCAWTQTGVWVKETRNGRNKR